MNDGIATPFVTLFLAVVVAEQASANQHWVIDAALEIALAIVVAIVVGGFGGRVIAQARRRGWATTASESLAVVTLSVLAYASATTIGGKRVRGCVRGRGFVGPVLTAGLDPTVLVYAVLSLARRYPAGQVVASVASMADPAVLICSIAVLTATSFAPRLG